eukprot:CCRYP_010347-RB/>CCRYP_010347-RB protein AED:0.32 eAED:0.26 QI:0/0/0/1/0/0/2/0/138
MWSMGGIKERYLHFENAGDQYLGRVVAGLDCNDYLFAVSRPYFDLGTVANEEETERSIDELVARYLVGGNSVHGLATIKFLWNSTKYTPPFTGLPPHVSLLSKIEDLTHQMDKMKVDFLTEMNKALDKRGVGSASCFA